MTVKLVAVRGECTAPTGERYACHAYVSPYMYEDRSVLRGYLLHLIEEAAARDGKTINPDTLTWDKMTPMKGFEREGNVEFI